MIFKTDSEELSIEEAQEMIKKHKKEQARYKKLEDYYLGDHAIKDMGGASPDRREYRLVNAYPRYITDFHTGFFMGQGVKYVAKDPDIVEDDDFLDEYLKIGRYNNEDKENLSLARSNSIKGDSYEILWIDEDAKVRYKMVAPETAFLVYGLTIDEEERFGVRYYSDEIRGRTYNFVEIYTSDHIFYYDDIGESGDMTLKDERDHPFGEAPLIHFKNNEHCKGDFEPVISLIDAYDREQTNTLNDMDEFSDAYLALINYGGTTDEDIAHMKTQRVLLVDGDGDVKWVTKDVNDSWVENTKNRLNKDIHKFSLTPDFTDESFGTNVPGVSLRLKLLTTEELRNIKELYFREGLSKRMRLIGNYLTIISDIDIIQDGIGMQFSDSLPQNVLETSQIVNNLANDLSTETRLSLLPFVESPLEEIEKKKQEDEEKMETGFAFYQGLGQEEEAEDEEEAEER